MKAIILRLVCAIAVLAGPGAQAQDTATSLGISNLACPDAKIFTGIFSKVCWSSMFPMRIVGRTAISGKDGINAPPGATDRAACLCRGDLAAGRLPTAGFTVGFWAPTKIIETTRQPYCSPTLGGVKFNGDSDAGTGILGAGKIGAEGNGGVTGSTDSGFRHWNLLTFPLLQMLQLMNVPMCNPDNALDLDLVQSSMFFPQWDRPEGAMFMNPEVAYFTNPVAMMALPASCLLASSGLTPQIDDAMHWAMGCWGASFPLYGDYSGGGEVLGSSLLAARSMMLLARLPFTSFANKTIGDEMVSGACSPTPQPILQKSAYKMSMLFPVAESGAGAIPTGGTRSDAGTTNENGEIDFHSITGGRCAHRIGETTMKWGEWRKRPGTGEDQVYLIWQWIDCCVGVF